MSDQYHIKEAQIYSWLEEYEFKLQWDTSSHPLEWLKFKRFRETSVGEDVELTAISIIAARNLK